MNYSVKHGENSPECIWFPVPEKLGVKKAVRVRHLGVFPFVDGDVTVNFENSNGHMIPIGEESTREENVVRSEEGNGSGSWKRTTSGGKGRR